MKNWIINRKVAKFKKEHKGRPMLSSWAGLYRDLLLLERRLAKTANNTEG